MMRIRVAVDVLAGAGGYFVARCAAACRLRPSIDAVARRPRLLRAPRDARAPGAAGADGPRPRLLPQLLRARQGRRRRRPLRGVPRAARGRAPPRRRRPRPHAGGRRQEAGGRAEPSPLGHSLPLLLSIPPELTSLANPRDGQEVYKLELQVETPTTGGPTRRLGPKSYTGARRRGEGELRARRARS